MSLREKSAWITAISVLICFGAYFGALVTGAVPHEGVQTVLLLVGCVIALVVLQIVLQILATVTTPKDGRTPRDERERQIQGRSHSLGYYVLVVLVLILGVPFHLGHPAADLMNFALLAVVVAELAVATAQIVMFRRGA